MDAGSADPRLLGEILDTGLDGDCAVVSAQTNVNYQQLRSQVRGVAATLWRGGVRAGDRVLVLLPNTASFPTSIFAVWRAGAVIVPMDIRSPAEQVVRVARDCQATGLVCNGAVFSRIETRIGEIPTLRFAVVEELRPTSSPIQIDLERYEDAVEGGGSPPEVTAQPGEFAALMYTSGSTGRPKGVMHSHESLLSSLAFTRDFIGIGPADRVLVAFSMHHLFSFRVLLVHLMAGATVIAATDILAGLKRIQETRPNALLLVPAACSLLTQQFAPVLRRCAPMLRRASIGSAAISPALLERLRRLLPDTKIHIPYGMTEARIGFLEPVEGRAERRLCAVDPNLELRVLDEGCESVEQGLGEVVLRGPALMLGYWHNRPTENQAIQEQGFRTRDLMEVSSTGERFLVGRLDDVINVGGEKVFPSEVEAALLGHPMIRDARVRGAADPRGERGEVVEATVVLGPGGSFDRQAILAHCRTRLEPYKLPVLIEVAREIQRDSMGKISRIDPA